MTTPSESGRSKPRRQLAAARRRRGWGQVRAAIEINERGLRLGYSEDELRVDAHALSRWERGVHEPKARYIRIMCSLYELPADQLGLAPMADDGTRAPSRPANLPIEHIAEGGSDTERRDLLRYGVGTVVTIVAGGASEWLGERSARTKRLIDPLALLRYASLDDSTPERDVPSLESLRKRVVAARSAYQTCQYAEMGQHLPRLLADIDLSTQVLSDASKLSAYALSAEAYHVTASLLLKHDDNGTAWIAADRSLRAAESSGDPRVIASSARIITHALMSGGHNATAAETASRMARNFSSVWTKPTPDDLSAYGSLLLRGAVAAAREGNRATAWELLDEAADTARRVGQDFSHRLNAFGQTNIDLHRIHIAVTQGDAGAALDLVRRIDLKSVSMVERKVSLLVDSAAALWQRGEFEQSYHALLAAESLAPEEMTARPAVRRLVIELLMHAPRHVVSDLNALAVRVGAIGRQE